MPNLPSFSVSSPEPAGYYFKWVSDLTSNSGRAWNMNRLNFPFSPFEVKEISSIQLSFSGQGDIIAWDFSKSGSYPVKSGYRLASSATTVVRGDGASSSFSTSPSF